MKVTLVSDDFIRPARPSERRHLALAKMDTWLMRTHYPPIVVFMPALSEGTSLEAFLVKCKTKLSETLAAVPPMAGRFKTQQGGMLAIDCNDAGVQFRVAQADCPLPESLASGSTLEGTESLFFEVPGTGGDVPLLLMQLTKFQDGRMSLFWGFHHTLTDGWGAFTFANYWAALMRGEKAPYDLCYERLDLLKASGKPLVSKDHPAMWDKPFFPLSKTVKYLLGFTAFRFVFPFIPKSLIYAPAVYRRIFFPRDKLKELKDEASRGLPPGAFVSTNDALSALIWRSITVARGLPETSPETATHLMFATNGRKVVPVPEGYIGNVHIPARTQSVTTKELASKPISWSAHMVRSAIKQVDATYIQNMVDWVEAQKDQDTIGPKTDHHQGPDVCISSLSDLPLAKTDLGFGPTLALGAAKYSIPFDGFILLVAYENEGGGVCADVSLLGTTMERLLAIKDFAYYTNAAAI